MDKVRVDRYRQLLLSTSSSSPQRGEKTSMKMKIYVNCKLLFATKNGLYHH